MVEFLSYVSRQERPAYLPPSFYRSFRARVPSDGAGVKGDLGRDKGGEGRNLFFESGLG